MKRVILLGLMLILGTLSMQSQNFKFGVNGGIPVGDADEFTTFQFGADVAYRFDALDILELGPMVGYSHYIGDEIDSGFGTLEFDDVQFVPIAASGRLKLITLLYVGADIGYALGVGDDTDGGFYFRPLAGLDLGVVALNLNYNMVSLDGGNISSLNIGVEFGL